MATATEPAELTNPLAAGAGSSLLPQPCVLVIFGAAGDLSWRKLLPAVYNLNVDGVLPSNFAVVGFGIGSKGDPDEWIRGPRPRRHRAVLAPAARRGALGRLLPRPLLRRGQLQRPRGLPARSRRSSTPSTSSSASPAAASTTSSIPPAGRRSRRRAAQGRRAWSTRPDEPTAFTRVIVEKPIGRDLESAREVNAAVAQAFAESQTYRIDHYLGKETVQNLLVLRFANSIFEPLWNEKYIDHVQITVAEEEGLTQYDPETGEPTASRIGYYEGVGALRDMVQNHMLQVLCMVAMEPPWSLERRRGPRRQGRRAPAACGRFSDADVEKLGRPRPVHRRRGRRPARARATATRSRLLHACATSRSRRIDHDRDVRRAAALHRQLALGGRAVLPAHRQAAAEAGQRGGHPVQGRAATSSSTPTPTCRSSRPCCRSASSPRRGCRCGSPRSCPGPKVRIYPGEDGVQLQLQLFGGTTPEAYERLMLDVMAGDATLFMRRDAVEAAWEFVMPILDHWEPVAEPLPAGVPGRHLGPARGRPPDRGRRPAVEDAMSDPARRADRRRPGRRRRSPDVEPELSPAHARGRRAPATAAGPPRPDVEPDHLLPDLPSAPPRSSR